MEEKPNYFAVIPASVRYDSDLTPNAKLLYGEITALCYNDGYCYATNDYFSKLYNVSKVSVSKWVSQLEEKGHISVEIEYRGGTKEILNRYIRILKYPIKEKFNTPIKEKFKENNTYTNNTRINNKGSIINNTKEIIDNYTEFEDLRETICEFVKFRKSLKRPLTDHALKLLLNKLDSLASDRYGKIDVLNQSMVNGWQGIFALKDSVVKKDYDF